MLHLPLSLEGIHWISKIENFDSASGASKRIYWTKAGVIRLGFFIKSERAKLFRDWAEKVILTVTAPSVNLPKVERRNHNRLNTSRLLEIMSIVALIDEKPIRVALMERLLPEKMQEGVQLQLFSNTSMPLVIDTKPKA